MNAALAALLHEKGCDEQIFEPPTEFEVVPSIIDPEDMFSNFDTQETEQESPKTPNDYMKMRHSYLNEIRNQDILKENNHKLEFFEQIARNGNPEELLDLFKRKHQWKKAVCEATQKGTICQNEYCPNYALVGSSFCPNHIHEDEKQNFFVQCPNCHRNRSKMIKCPFCGK